MSTVIDFGAARRRIEQLARLHTVRQLRAIVEIEYTPRLTLGERIARSAGVEGLAEVARVALEESK